MIYIIFGVLAFIGLFAGIVLATKFIFNRTDVKDIVSKHKDDPGAHTVFVKKYPEADVNTYHGLFLRFGLVLALALVILAFEWTTYDRGPVDLGQVVALDEFEIEPPQTKREPPPPPPPPPPEIEIVEDEEILEDEPEIEDMDIEEEEVIEIPDIPEPEPESNEEEIFMIVEDMPVFPGGEAGLLSYLSKIPYPPIARENDIEGTVFVRFVVDKTGKVIDVSVARGADKILNEAALQHIKAMPKWTPGKQRGKAVKVQYVVPIKFKLN